MKLLVTGSKGQLGSDVVSCSKKAGISCLGTARQDFDIADREATMDFITGYKPDVVIHCASYNAVERAESAEALCHTVNVQGTANIAEACLSCNSKMMFISTDYVFDGTKEGAYETDDAVHPLSVYGRSKANGELEVQKRLQRFFIIRTSWLFGKNGSNFVKTMRSLSSIQNQISVVNDQFGSPTYTVDLAPLLVKIAQSEKYGIYHATNEGFCSWAEFAEEIMRRSQSICKIIPIGSSEFHADVVRPKNSRLSKERLLKEGFNKLPPWQDALQRFLDLTFNI